MAAQKLAELVLSERETAVLEQIAAVEEAPINQRVQALLALNAGDSQEEAAEATGLRPGQVRYWLRKYRKHGLSVFPDVEVVETGTETETETEVEVETAVAPQSAVKKPKNKKKKKKEKKMSKAKKDKKKNKKSGKEKKVSKKKKSEKKGKSKKSGKNKKEKKSAKKKKK
jgi:outer membrane biosynthesis protein TonB